MILETLKTTVVEHSSHPVAIQIWYLKENIQAEVLSYIYGNKDYSDLIFYWWTSIRFLLWLDRLSEDLDFVYPWEFNYQKLADDLVNCFRKIWLEIDAKLQKFRITLKFRNLLQNFWIKYQNSDDLYLKIEISDHFSFCKNFKTQIYPIDYKDKSMFIKSLEPSTLFATKLNAVLYRQREKKTPNGVLYVKWRDFYDLFRYLKKWIMPNIDCIQDIEDLNDLKTKLSKTVNNVDFDLVYADLIWFLEDSVALDFIKTNWKSYILEQIEKW